LITKRGGAREGRVLRHTASLHRSFAIFEATPADCSFT
jgi:hypothetical protein